MSPLDKAKSLLSEKSKTNSTAVAALNAARTFEKILAIGKMKLKVSCNCSEGQPYLRLSCEGYSSEWHVSESDVKDLQSVLSGLFAEEEKE